MTRKSEVTILREFIKEKHKERLGIDYVTRSHAVEGRMMKNFTNEYGIDVATRFVDACFLSYTPTAKYPGLNFSFMYSYMKERILPKVLAEIKRERERQQIPQQELSDSEFDDFI